MTLTDEDLDALEAQAHRLESNDVTWVSMIARAYARDVPALIAALREARALLARWTDTEPVGAAGACVYCGADCLDPLGHEHDPRCPYRATVVYLDNR